MQRLKDGVEPDLPDVPSEALFLVGYLFDAGPTSAAGQHGAALTWTDLRAWQAGAGINLPPWQLRLLRRLSGEYLSESLTANAHDAPPPWEREPDREKLARHIRRIIRG